MARDPTWKNLPGYSKAVKSRLDPTTKKPFPTIREMVAKGKGQEAFLSIAQMEAKGAEGLEEDRGKLLAEFLGGEGAPNLKDWQKEEIAKGWSAVHWDKKAYDWAFSRIPGKHPDQPAAVPGAKSKYLHEVARLQKASEGQRVERDVSEVLFFTGIPALGGLLGVVGGSFGGIKYPYRGYTGAALQATHLPVAPMEGSAAWDKAVKAKAEQKTRWAQGLEPGTVGEKSGVKFGRVEFPGKKVRFAPAEVVPEAERMRFLEEMFPDPKVRKDARKLNMHRWLKEGLTAGQRISIQKQLKEHFKAYPKSEFDEVSVPDPQVWTHKPTGIQYNKNQLEDVLAQYGEVQSRMRDGGLTYEEALKATWAEQEKKGFFIPGRSLYESRHYPELPGYTGVVKGGGGFYGAQAQDLRGQWAGLKRGANSLEKMPASPDLQPDDWEQGTRVMSGMHLEDGKARKAARVINTYWGRRHLALNANSTSDWGEVPGYWKAWVGQAPKAGTPRAADTARMKESRQAAAEYMEPRWIDADADGEMVPESIGAELAEPHLRYARREAGELGTVPLHAQVAEKRKLAKRYDWMREHQLKAYNKNMSFEDYMRDMRTKDPKRWGKLSRETKEYAARSAQARMDPKEWLERYPDRAAWMAEHDPKWLGEDIRIEPLPGVDQSKYHEWDKARQERVHHPAYPGIVLDLPPQVKRSDYVATGATGRDEFFHRPEKRQAAEEAWYAADEEWRRLFNDAVNKVDLEIHDTHAGLFDEWRSKAVSRGYPGDPESLPTVYSRDTDRYRRTGQRGGGYGGDYGEAFHPFHRGEWDPKDFEQGWVELTRGSYGAGGNWEKSGAQGHTKEQLQWLHENPPPDPHSVGTSMEMSARGDKPTAPRRTPGEREPVAAPEEPQRPKGPTEDEEFETLLPAESPIRKELPSQEGKFVDVDERWAKQRQAAADRIRQGESFEREAAKERAAPETDDLLDAAKERHREAIAKGRVERAEHHRDKAFQAQVIRQGLTPIVSPSDGVTRYIDRQGYIVSPANTRMRHEVTEKIRPHIPEDYKGPIATEPHPVAPNRSDLTGKMYRHADDPTRVERQQAEADKMLEANKAANKARREEYNKRMYNLPVSSSKRYQWSMDAEGKAYIEKMEAAAPKSEEARLSTTLEGVGAKAPSVETPTAPAPKDVGSLEPDPVDRSLDMGIGAIYKKAKDVTAKAVGRGKAEEKRWKQEMDKTLASGTDEAAGARFNEKKAREYEEELAASGGGISRSDLHPEHEDYLPPGHPDHLPMILDDTLKRAKETVAKAHQQGKVSSVASQAGRLKRKAHRDKAVKDRDWKKLQGMETQRIRQRLREDPSSDPFSDPLGMGIESTTAKVRQAVAKKHEARKKTEAAEISVEREMQGPFEEALEREYERASEASMEDGGWMNPDAESYYDAAEALTEEAWSKAYEARRKAKGLGMTTDKKKDAWVQSVLSRAKAKMTKASDDLKKVDNGIHRIQEAKEEYPSAR